MKILIVDDSEGVRAGIRSAITAKTDWTVCGEAENGKLAVSMVQDLEPHLVLLDLSMPGMNGLEAAQQISVIAPDLPIILFTLHDSRFIREEAQRVGINQVFSKADGFGANVLEAMRALLTA